MSATVESRNDKIAGLGSLGLHAVLIGLLFLVKCPGTGGGGGNDGLGNSGYMSMDVAGIGNNVDGWGPTEEEVEVTPTQPQPVVEEASSVTDDSQVEEAPVVTPNKPTPKPTTPTTKPTPTPKPEPTPEPKPSKAAGIIKGSGSSSGNTNQGTEEGTIGGKGVLGGGGSQGSGGGTGGGQGTGSGTGTGAGSGPGSGGGSKTDHTLAGRTMIKPPSLGENFEENATMVVNITVNEQGKVISAKYDFDKSKFSNPKFIDLAEKAAMSTQFDVSKTGATQQRGTITIYFKAK